MTNRPAGGFAEVNGTRLAYEVTGSRHPLTLIHGVLVNRHLCGRPFPVAWGF